VTAGCEHGAGSHDGTEPSMASAPEASRAWLLIEHHGPWPPEPTEAELPHRCTPWSAPPPGRPAALGSLAVAALA